MTKKSKELRELIKTKTEEEITLKEIITSTQAKLTLLKKEIKELWDAVECEEFSTVTEATDHAIVRYLQRVKGINVEEITKEIIDDQVIEQIKELGVNGTFINKNGLRVIIKNNKVVTIM